MKKLHTPLYLVALVVIIGFVSCTKKDRAYRTLPMLGTKDPGCDIAVELTRGDYQAAVSSETESSGTGVNRTSCYLSSFLVPKAALWKDLPNGNRIKEPDHYTLSFVELPEAKAALPDHRQLDDLIAHLSSNKQDIVMVYVHGWRHDAIKGNGNVRRFRTMLGYTRSALNARCIETGNYCDARLTGVYIGWRGRSFNESTEAEASFPGLIGAIPTVWGRKNQSEKLASPKGFNFEFEGKQISPIGYVLKNIEDTLRLKHGDPLYDKMLVVGHSFGGNMLATYLEPLAKADIMGHTHGEELGPVLGDLVVLLNPASEAQKWTSIQRALRLKASIDETNYWVSRLHEATPVQAALVKRWKKMFPRSQRPFYVSITAANNWSPGEFNKQTRSLDVQYDKATGILFPISQAFVGQGQPEKTHAIGHLVPEYSVHQYIVHKDGVDLVQKMNRIAGPPYGVSHEFIVNRGTKLLTSYENSGDPSAAKCGTHDGWLRRAQEEDYGGFGSAQENWDTGYSGGNSTDRPLLNNMTGGAELQIRNALYLSSGDPNSSKGIRAESVAQGRSPFWNMRALDTAIANHSDFMNFPTLCGINILWLDDATAQNFFRPAQ